MLMGNGIMCELPDHFSQALFMCTFSFIIYGLLMSLFKTNKQYSVFTAFWRIQQLFFAAANENEPFYAAKAAPTTKKPQKKTSIL